MSPATHAVQILIVEDNPALRLLLTRTLEDRAVVREAEDGIAALEALQKQPADLLIVDLHMPRMDGLTLCRLLRADPTFQALRIVMVSSDDDAEQVRAIMAAGVSAYITKPYRAKQIRELVDTLLAT